MYYDQAVLFALGHTTPDWLLQAEARALRPRRRWRWLSFRARRG